MERTSGYNSPRHWRCRVCGAESPIEAKTCSGCGRDLATCGEIKLPLPAGAGGAPPFNWKILVGVAALVVGLLAAVLPRIPDIIGSISKPAVNLLMEDAFQAPETEDEEAKKPENYPVFHSSYTRKQIRSLTILDTLKTAPAESANCWNVTAYANGEEKNGKVLAWVEEHGGYYSLFIAGEGGVTAPADCSAIFKGYTELERVEWNGAFLTNQTVVTDGMFEDCAKLVALDVSSFDMSGVKSMRGMFRNCVSLKTLNMSGWDLSHAETFSDMFEKCGKLTSLDVSGFDTSSATSMYGMFSECVSLETLDVSGFQTSNVTNFAYMFWKCGKLTSLDVSGFDTFYSGSFRSMFSECVSLEALDVSGFQTSSATNFSYMFNKCGALTALDVSHFNTSAATTLECMFQACEKVTSLDVSQFDFGKAETTGYMFNNCKALTSLTFANPVTLGEHMFCHDAALENISFNGALKQAEAEAEKNMFEGCNVVIHYPALDASWSEAAGKQYGGTLTWIKALGDIEITDGVEGVSPEESYQYLFDDNNDTNWLVELSKSPYVEWNVREPIPVTQVRYTAVKDSEQYPARGPRSFRLLGRASEEEEWLELSMVTLETPLTNSTLVRTIVWKRGDEFIPYAELPKYKFFRLEITETFGDSLAQLSGVKLNSEEVT